MPSPNAARCDFMTEIATPFAVTVVMELLGLPLADRDKFSRLLHDYNNYNSPSGERYPDIRHLSKPLTAYLIEQFYSGRRAGILDALLHGDDPLTDDEVLGVAAMMCAAGTGTVAGALGYALWELARNPELVRIVPRRPRPNPGIRRRGNPSGGRRPGNPALQHGTCRNRRFHNPRRKQGQSMCGGAQPHRRSRNERRENPATPALGIRCRPAPLPRLPPGPHGDETVISRNGCSGYPTSASHRATHRG